MNSNFMRAPGGIERQHSKEGALLNRNSFKYILGLVLVTLLAASGAFATPSTQVANEGLFRPRGMVRSTVPDPNGGPALHDFWVSDGASGFCRIDRLPDPKFPGKTHGVLNLSTCYLPGVFEPMDYQVETLNVNGSNGYVFVGGIKEITRLEFMPSPTEPGRTVINTATQVTIFSSVNSVFTNGAPVNGPRFVQSLKLGPDGKLYLCFQGSGDIWRVLNPLSPSFTKAGNAVERVGTSDNGKTLLSLAWIGHDLWMAQAGFLNRIQNADQCNYTLPKCQAVLEFGKLQTQEGMQSDQYFSTIPNGRWLYWGNGNRVVRFDTQSADIMQVWNQSGFVNGSAIPQEYSLIMGINFIQRDAPVALADGSFLEDMTVTTDPIIEAPLPEVAATLPRTGRTWLLTALPTLVPEPCNTTTPVFGNLNPPPCVNSQIGNDAPPIDSPQFNAARRSVLMLAGVTHARGLIFLQTNWWISDEDNGFCRIDLNAVTGAASMSNCFQPAGFWPGQPAADAPDASGAQNVYVPNACGLISGCTLGGGTPGIMRLKFIPDGTGGTVSQTGVLNSGRGTPSAVAIPNGPFNDGAVYIGYYDNGKINKVQQPATAPGAPLPVGGLLNSVGLLSMAFQGNDLYMAEIGPPVLNGGQLVKKGQVSVLVAASPDASRGSAQPVAKPISRLQSPTTVATPQLFVNPGAMVVGPDGDRERCLPPLGVKLSAGIPADPGTAPALYMGGLGLPADSAVSGGLAQPPEVVQYGSICTTMIDWVIDGALDPTLSLNVDLGPVTALAFNGADSTSNLAIADDPGLIIPDQTLQKSQVTPPLTGLHGQGHVFIVP
ncbi:MAG TPA: hypothetical protein VJN64_05435 [Terriglobales bacterium]|nr:hypothetical protein [Terriglobales bacterium]